jgi:hypothetical protein
MSRRDKGAQAVLACAAVGAKHKVVFMGVVVGVEHEAASMGGQQARSTKQSGA